MNKYILRVADSNSKVTRGQTYQVIDKHPEGYMIKQNNGDPFKACLKDAYWIEVPNFISVTKAEMLWQIYLEYKPLFSEFKFHSFATFVKIAFGEVSCKETSLTLSQIAIIKEALAVWSEVKIATEAKPKEPSRYDKNYGIQAKPNSYDARVKELMSYEHGIPYETLVKDFENCFYQSTQERLKRSATGGFLDKFALQQGLIQPVKILPEEFKSIFPSLNKPVTKGSKTMQQIIIKQVTTINDRDSDQYTDTQLLEMIADQQSLLENLETFKVKSRAINALVKKHTDNIKGLTEILDARYPEVDTGAQDKPEDASWAKTESFVSPPSIIDHRV